MSIVVLKYGGSSVSDTGQIGAIARQIIQAKAAGDEPVVVVSAMGNTTDQFLKMAYAITDRPGARELDMLLSVGERISIALLAMAINALGPYEAVSLTGSQVGIITDTNHTQAKIVEVRCGRIFQVLEQGKIPIIAGFQGVSIEKEITTLGRGGSDTTAVALAAALGASQCRIMKDVAGVYTADPRQVPEAHLIDQVSYDQMLEFSATGSKVLAVDSVALARQHNVEIAVGISTTGAIGTIVTAGDFSGGGAKGVVAYRKLKALRLHQHSVLATALADLQNCRVAVRSLHSEGNRPVLLIDALDEFPQTERTKKKTSLSKIESRIEQTEWGHKAWHYRRLFVRVSIIGSGLEPGGRHFTRLLEALAGIQCQPRWFCCSPIRISFCAQDEQVPDLLNCLHRGLIEYPSAK
ncbi:MAG: aspartate kinase [bacterium]